MYYLYKDENEKYVVSLFPLNMQLVFKHKDYNILKKYMDEHGIKQH